MAVSPATSLQWRPARRVRRAGLDLLAGGVQQLPGGLGGGVHVREHRLDHLQLGDRLAELARSVAYCRGRLERALGDAHRLRRDPRPDRSNVCIAMPKPSPSAPSRLAHRNADAVEGELRRGRAAEAHLVLETGGLEPGPIGLHHDR